MEKRLYSIVHVKTLHNGSITPNTIGKYNSITSLHCLTGQHLTVLLSQFVTQYVVKILLNLFI